MELLGVLAYKRLKYLFYTLLVTVAVYFINTLFIFYMDLRLADYSPASLDEVPVPQQRTSNIRPHQYYKRIWERNLFSVKTDETEKFEKDDLTTQIDKLSLTSLNCTLIGTIINEGGNSLAIIKDNQTKRQDRYRVGSTVSGAKVVLILRNRVVLNINGKDELLVMGIEKIRTEKAVDEKSIKGDTKEEVVTYKVSKGFVQESINNVAQIMSKVRIRPYFENGRPAGFKINRIKKGSIFKTMGFENNDIVKTVNGQDIHSAEDIMRLYNTLKDSNFFSIGIVRNNQTKTLNYKVR